MEKYRRNELILQEGSDEETTVDHYISSGESAEEEEDFVKDIPQVDDCSSYETESENEASGIDDTRSVHTPVEGDDDDDDDALDLFADFELEIDDDSDDPPYDPDADVDLSGDDVDDDDDNDDDDDDDDDMSEWVKNLKNFPLEPDFTPDPKAGLQDHVFANNDDPTSLDAYRVFLTDDFVKKIQHETNEYARRAIQERRHYFGGAVPPKTIFSRWRPVTVSDMLNFLACCVHMGLVKRSKVMHYWTRHPALHASYCSHLLSRTRFMDILSFLHINDNTRYVPFGHKGHDPIHKIRPFVDHLNKVFKSAYVPGKNVCVDEAVCPYKGRSRFRLYMKKKPVKWGFKFYQLRDSANGYVYSFEMFCADKRLSNKPYDVVLRLMQPLLNKGYQLYLGNYYCCPQLCQDLAAQGTMVCGTVRKNRTGMPRELCVGDLPKGHVDYRRKGPVVACRWRDEKDVYTLSTVHRPSLHLAQGRYELKLKPVVVVSYITNTAGVDHTDQLLRYFPMHRKSVKWWKKPFFHLLTTVMVQAMIILNSHRRQHGKKEKSLQDVVKDVLIQMPAGLKVPIIPHVALGDRLRLTERHFPKSIPATTKGKPYKNCKVCYAKARASGVSRMEAKSKRKQTCYWCADCGVSLCVIPCFQVWHTHKDVLK